MTVDILIKIAVSVGSAMMLSILGYYITKIKGLAKEQKAIKQGMQALLRDRIIQMYNHYSAKNHIPIYARENIEGLHKEYTALGGNGVVKSLKDRLMLLPTDHPADPDAEDRSVID